MDNISLLNGSEIAYSTASFFKQEDEYYMRCLLAEGDTIKLVQELPAAGLYCLQMIHRSPCDSFHSLLINGAYYGGIHFSAADQKTTVTTPAFRMEKGGCEITLWHNWGELCFFSMTLCPAQDERPPHRPDFRLSNPNASRECAALMRYLKSIYGKRVIIGQHNDFNCADADYIERITGRLPALMGFDLMSYSAAAQTPDADWACMSEVSHCKRNVDAALHWAKERKALLTLCWHWYSPSKGRDKSFYTVNTGFDVERAMAERGEDYRLLLEDMDRIAEQLKRLRDEHIPVLWRPLHEADGGWFWWGAKGAKPYIALYRLMYDRFTRLHGLDNLIWVFNAPREGWYPGDDMVDLNCMDIYGPKGNDGPLCLEYARGIGLSLGDKPLGLGEVGTLPDLERVIKKAPWLWLMLWGGFTHDTQSNPVESLKRNYGGEIAVCLDDIVKVGLY